MVVGTRDEYYRDGVAPSAERVLASAFAVVRDDAGYVLLARRADDHYWELPGGRIEVGESAAEAAMREVGEETGLKIDILSLAGVDSDPSHILVYPDEGASQQVAIYFHARPNMANPHQEIRPDQHEIIDVTWADPADLNTREMHPAMRRRLLHSLHNPHVPHFN